MKILITGANGLLGQHLTQKLLEKRYLVISTGKGQNRLFFGENDHFSYEELDVTDRLLVSSVLLQHRPDVVVHAAAMTQVDVCEHNKVDCWNVNVMATRFLLDAAKEINARFIFLSTDFVFDGLSQPYSESSKPNPVNYYGSTKWEAEHAVTESGLQWAIIRTVLVIGNGCSGTRQNIVTWVKNKLEKGEPIQVVDDQFRTPTFIEDLVNGLLLVLEKNATGIFHISGKEEMTPYEIAIETARFLHLNEDLIKKTDSAALSQLAFRPSRTRFNIEKAMRELGYQPHSFAESLRIVLGGENQEVR